MELTVNENDDLQKAFDIVGVGLEYNVLRFKPGLYMINKPLKMNSGTTLIGEEGVKMKLMDKAPTNIFSGDPDKNVVPVIGQKEKTISDIEICYFEYDGNKDNQDAIHGKNYHNFVYLTNATNIYVHDMYIHDLQGDGVRIRDGDKILCEKNRVEYSGHDGFHMRNSVNIDIRNNNIKLRINSGARIINCDKARIYDNYIDGYVQEGQGEWSRGGSGIQVDHIEDLPCTENLVYNNHVVGSYGAGIWATNFAVKSLTKSQGLKIYNNIFEKCGNNPFINWIGGIVTSGWHNLEIYNNTFVDNVKYGIVVMVGSSVSGTKPKGTGYKIKINRNIIVGSEYGIANLLSTTHTINASENDIVCKKAFKSVTWDDKHINKDPLFVNGYHLQSPAGHWTSEGYVNDKLLSPCVKDGYEFGRYGGTNEASKYPIILNIVCNSENIIRIRELLKENGVEIL